MTSKRTPLILADNFKFNFQKSSEEKVLTPDTLDATLKLEAAVKAAGGTFSLNAMFRSWSKQQSLVDLHKADPVHNAYAAPPGASYHQAGRALDINIKGLNFPGIPQEKWLEKLWSLYKPLGFRPVIATPDMNASEAWHTDFLGPWQNVYDKMGNITAAKCAILDVGNWNPQETPEKVRNMFIQSQLLRLGKYEIGAVDGVIGPKCQKAIQEIKVTDLEQVAQLLSMM